MCTVSAGLVRVKVKAVEDDDENDDAGDASTQEFSIGPQGLFKVVPGMECRIVNWAYEEAILQVIGVAGSE